MENCRKYLFITDPGHGWLRVPLVDITDSGAPISRYSYRDHTYGYLEEDCDAGAFLQAVADMGGECSITHDSSACIAGAPECFIRRLAHWR